MSAKAKALGGRAAAMAAMLAVASVAVSAAHGVSGGCCKNCTRTAATFATFAAKTCNSCIGAAPAAPATRYVTRGKSRFFHFQAWHPWCRASVHIFRIESLVRWLRREGDGRGGRGISKARAVIAAHLGVQFLLNEKFDSGGFGSPLKRHSTGATGGASLGFMRWLRVRRGTCMQRDIPIVSALLFWNCLSKWTTNNADAVGGEGVRGVGLDVNNALGKLNAELLVARDGAVGFHAEGAETSAQRDAVEDVYCIAAV